MDGGTGREDKSPSSCRKGHRRPASLAVESDGSSPVPQGGSGLQVRTVSSEAVPLLTDALSEPPTPTSVNSAPKGPTLTPLQPCTGLLLKHLSLPDRPGVKNLPASGGDADLIPGFRRSPGEGSGNPLWYSCLGNHMDRGAQQATVPGVTKEPDTTE